MKSYKNDNEPKTNEKDIDLMLKMAKRNSHLNKHITIDPNHHSFEPEKQSDQSFMQ